MAARVPRTSRALLTALLTLAAVVVLLIPIGAIIQIVLTSQLDDRTPTQAIIVLVPAGVWGDPTAVMNARLDHARDLYQDHVAPVIVLAGPPAAVRQATDHLVRGGVPKADIVGFSANSDTTGSLEVIASAMADLHWSTATLVTDPADAARASATASSFGIDAHSSSVKTGPGTALTSEAVSGETAALVRYYLLTRWTLPNVIASN